MTRFSRRLHSVVGVAVLSMTLAGLAAPATAATFRIQADGNGHPNCTNFDISSSSPLGASGGCLGHPLGIATGQTSAAFGQIGVAAGVTASTPQPMAYSTDASYEDSVIFTSSDPLVTEALVAMNLVLDGQILTYGIAQSRLEGNGFFGSNQFIFVLERTDEGTTVLNNLSFAGGTLNGDKGYTNATLRTPYALIPMGTPIGIRLAMKAGTFGREPGSGGEVDFAHTFGAPFGSDVFELPAGVTANSGTWLVNNRRIDPGAGVVPEPATWALMIGGFGMAGVALRRRPRAMRRPAHPANSPGC